MDTGIKKTVYKTSPLYGLGFIGALIFFIQHATGFWAGVWGFFQALVWPAVIVYKLLIFLKA